MSRRSGAGDHPCVCGRHFGLPETLALHQTYCHELQRGSGKRAASPQRRRRAIPK